MTHCIQIGKTEFHAITSGVLPYFHTKDKGFKMGDKVIFQEQNGEDKLTGEEHEVILNNLYQGDGIKAKFICLGWKSE